MIFPSSFPLEGKVSEYSESLGLGTWTLQLAMTVFPRHESGVSDGCRVLYPLQCHTHRGPLLTREARWMY